MKMKTIDDRLSELPDLLILEILSLLPVRDVVRTTILSKRWMDLWTTIPCLDFRLPPKKKKGFWIRLLLFCHILEKEKKNDERKFNNQVQKHWKGMSLRKFNISFIDQPLSGEIDSWLRFATEKKVQELCLNLPFDWSKPLESPEYWLPQCIYSCSSITKLWITGSNLGIQESVKWDKLKTLFLQGICFSEDVINQVVSSAPSLECLELRLRRSSHNLNIQSNSLKRLTVVKYNEYTHEYDPSRYSMLTICAPKLESLEFIGSAYSECKLLMDGASLTHASLGFYDKWYAVVEETLKQILPVINHVESVTLSPCAYKMLGVMQTKKLVLPFWKVKTLRLFGGLVKPNEIVSLAKIFPLVGKLEIEWKLDEWYLLFLENLAKNSTYVESEARRPKNFMMQLRKVEITGCPKIFNVTAAISLVVFLKLNATMLQETVLFGHELEAMEAKIEAFEAKIEAFEAKIKKLQKQFKHSFKWGLLGIGITVTAYTVIKWWPPQL